jgi:hypothetical protein
MLELLKDLLLLMIIQPTPLESTKISLLSLELPTFTTIKLDNSQDKYGQEMLHMLISELSMLQDGGVIN